MTRWCPRCLIHVLPWDAGLYGNPTACPVCLDKAAKARAAAKAQIGKPRRRLSIEGTA